MLHTQQHGATSAPTGPTKRITGAQRRFGDDLTNSKNLSGTPAPSRQQQHKASVTSTAKKSGSTKQRNAASASVTPFALPSTSLTVSSSSSVRVVGAKIPIAEDEPIDYMPPPCATELVPSATDILQLNQSSFLELETESPTLLSDAFAALDDVLEIESRPV